MIPIIEEAAIRKVITPQVAVDAMRAAFRADGEGRAHVPAVINLEVPAQRVIAWSPDRPHLEAYIKEMRGEGFDARAAATPEEVCRAADVLITATPSRTPLVQAEWLRPGQHVTALGSDSPGKQELDAACLERADLLVVDRLTQCASFGELRHALDAGLIRPDRVHGELGEIVAGVKPG